MPSHLGDYTSAGGRYHAASDRVEKFGRAVQSVIGQTHQEWELLVVADGCELTWAMSNAYADPRIRFLRVPKQRQWNGKVRNAGIHKATGHYIIYLDSDDVFGPGHLAAVAAGLAKAGDPAWALIDERVWDTDSYDWVTRSAPALFRRGAAGTQNIVHRRDLNVYWPEPQYRHPEYGYGRDDRGMVKALKFQVGDPIHIPGAEHYIMHIPGEYDL